MEIKKKYLKILQNKIHNHFVFLKKSKNFQESIIKNIEISNNFSLIIFNEKYFDKQFKKLAIKNKLRKFNQKKENLVFILIDEKNLNYGFIKISTLLFKKKLFLILKDFNIYRKIDFINLKKILHGISKWSQETFFVSEFLIEEKIYLNLKKTDIYKKIALKKLDFIKNKNSTYFVLAKNIYDKREILTAGPSISSLEKFYTYDATSNGWNNNMSKYLEKFENKVSEIINTKYSISTSSATGAIQIALMALNIGPNDEVIVPDVCWVSAPNAVQYVGAKPIFAEVEKENWNIDPNNIEKHISKKTKAIIPVHMYGQPAQIDKIIKIAKKYNLKVIEDAAPAMGSTWKNKPCGSFGDFSVFSFQGAKILAIGEGGLLTTNNKLYFDKAKKIWNQGRNKNKTFWIDNLGVKYKMSNIQASLGLGQLERLDEFVWMKRRIFSWYKENLGDFKKIKLINETNHSFSNYWMSSLYLNDNFKKRDYLIKELKKNNIDTRPVFPAVSQYQIWGKINKTNPISKDIGLRGLNLPSGVKLTQNEIYFVSKKIKEILS